MNLDYWNNWTTGEEFTLIEISSRREDDRLIISAGLIGLGLALVINLT